MRAIALSVHSRHSCEVVDLPRFGPDTTVQMTELKPNKYKLITFDCYGTLVDWEAGLRNSLLSIQGVARDDLGNLVQEYVRTEATFEQQAWQPYAKIQRLTLQSLASLHHWPLPDNDADLFSRDLVNWAPFDDTVANLKLLKSQYMLGILSNIDVDLFAETNKHLQVDFDLIITAEDVRSYKPSHAHFLRAVEQSGIPKDGILHVAQSLFHDAAPAADLGFDFIWINRYGQARPNDIPMLGEFSDLASLANKLCESPDRNV